jgi:hypothetical protein
VVGEQGLVDAAALERCASQDGVCTFEGERTVYYGAEDQFFRRRMSTSANCNSATFGDPIPGLEKACYLFLPEVDLTWTTTGGSTISGTGSESDVAKHFLFDALAPGTTTVQAATAGGLSRQVQVTVIAPFMTHRWSFDETGGAGTSLRDPVGGLDGTIVDVGSNNAVVGNGQVRLAGGNQGNTDYVSFDRPLQTPPGTQDISIELWATQHGVENWSRIFDFGKDATDYLMMSWTRGTALGQDRVEWRGEQIIDDTMAPYELDREYHIVLTLDARFSVSSVLDATSFLGTTVRWYLDGVERGSFQTQSASWHQIDMQSSTLGRSRLPADNTANASYNELRIWRGALTAPEVLASFQGGANAGRPTTGSIEVRAVTTGTNQDPDGYVATVDGGGGQRVDPNGKASFSDLLPGGHTVGLSDIAPNCSLAGDNPRTVNVTVGQTTTVSFEVTCA